MCWYKKFPVSSGLPGFRASGLPGLLLGAAAMLAAFAFVGRGDWQLINIDYFFRQGGNCCKKKDKSQLISE